MKTTRKICQKLNELIREAKTLDGIRERDNFEEQKWYSEEEIKRKLSQIKFLPFDMIELNEIIIEDKLFKELFGDEE